ncbi:MAG: single-stranded DNA-binding protein, partial [Limisphaerales bacterium]
MASFNKVILMGNITRDPELRYTPKGMAVTRITVAVNRRWRAETGELREEATFVDVDAYGQQAETLAKHLKKGNPILVEGRLRQHSWEDKQTNQKRSILRVDLERFSFVGPANRE